jgi:hypothetical protein
MVVSPFSSIPIIFQRQRRTGDVLGEGLTGLLGECRDTHRGVYTEPLKCLQVIKLVARWALIPLRPVPLLGDRSERKG